MIARVEVRRVRRLVLALEHARDPRREAAERLVRRVDDEPAPLDLALADRVGLRAHRFSVVSVCRLCPTPPPPEGDAPEAEPASRGGCPVASRSSGRRAPPGPLSRSFFRARPRGGRPRCAGPCPGGRRRPNVDRHELTLPPDPDRMHGPDRRLVPVHRPEGREVVPADEGLPGSVHRVDVERVPHPERVALAKRAARPVPDGVAVLPVPRRSAWMELRSPPAGRRGSRCPAAGRPLSAGLERRRGRAAGVGECDHLPQRVNPGVRASGPVDRLARPIAEAGERGFEFPLDRPDPGSWTWKPAKSVPSYSTRARYRTTRSGPAGAPSRAPGWLWPVRPARSGRSAPRRRGAARSSRSGCSRTSRSAYLGAISSNSLSTTSGSFGKLRRRRPGGRSGRRAWRA